jgi:hypothetical protein
MVSEQDVRKSLGISREYDVELDDDVKFNEIRHGVSFKCKHCQSAFMSGFDQVYVYKSTPMRGDARCYNPDAHSRYILATECPVCKAHIAAWAANSDAYMYLGRQ